MIGNITKMAGHGVRGGAVVAGIIKLFVVVLASSMLVACASDNKDDLLRYVKSVKSKKAGRIAPLPEFKTYESFSYHAGELRDPFDPFEDKGEEKVVDTGIGLRPDVTRHKEALEDFPLDTLHFVGHLERGGNTWAIVTAPDGLVYRVKTGNYVGQNHGKINMISESRIDIVEIVPDGMGGWIEREAALSLTE